MNPTLRPARFITFEGIEGVGKSTQIQAAAAYLQAQQIPLLITREPGGTALGEEIRQVLLHTRASIQPVSELLLILAARAQHVQEIIQPALNAGTWVICDRFRDATYAYQGGGRGLDPTLMASLEPVIQGTLQPDLTLILDAPPNVGLQRIKTNRGTLDRFEQEQYAFFERVRKAYLDRATHHARYQIIDALQTPAHVQQTIRHCLQTRLNL